MNICIHTCMFINISINILTAPENMSTSMSIGTPMITNTGESMSPTSMSIRAMTKRRTNTATPKKTSEASDRLPAGFLPLDDVRQMVGLQVIDRVIIRAEP